jgi:hypothetical protein
VGSYVALPFMYLPGARGFLVDFYTSGPANDALGELKQDASLRTFLGSCLQHIAQNGKSDAVLSLQRAEWLLRTLREVALLNQRLPARTIVVFDESLSQRVNSVAPWTESGGDIAREYFGLVPAPSLLIHLSATPDVVLSRLRRRRAQHQHTISSHRGLSEKELYDATAASAAIAAEGAKRLSERGVPVLSVDGGLPVPEIVKHVESFVCDSYGSAA